MSNKSLAAVFYCSTSEQKWGKGFTIQEAKKNAGVKGKAAKNFQYYVVAAIFDNPTEEELNNLFKCIVSNNFYGSPEFYQDQRTNEDTLLIDLKLVGWLTIERNY